MYMGHFAFGLAAKSVAPKAPLGILLVCTQVIDILYALFVLIGVSSLKASPWDHGLLMSLVWSAAACAIYYLFFHNLRGGILVGILVLSHWIGDFISWDRALPLAFNDMPRVGLGLYNSFAVMLGVDFGLFGLALALYLIKTRAKDRAGQWAPWLLVAYLLALIPAATLPGKLIIFMAIGMAMVAPLGMWIDRHRSASPAQPR